MGWLGRFYGSTVGKKIVMALTGMALVAYVVGHMLGNLLVFRGPAALNSYAELLRSNMALLWAVRAVLLAALLLHVHAAWALTRLNRAARASGYSVTERRAATLSARSLRMGGVVLLAFVIFHLLHLTSGTVHPAFSPDDVYGNVLVGFSVPAVVVFYLVAMAALALHLHHGVWSLFQTLGVSHPRLDRGRRRLALVLAVVVPAGFAAVPLAVAFGLVR
jgi:succinate dehydrogenase / fumarate reductase cytochrome b subunit